MSSTVPIVSVGAADDGASLPHLVDDVADFTGRRWAFQRVIRWLNDDDSRLFLVHGQPGAGKSALAAHLLELSRAPASANDALAHVVDFSWFCRYSSTLTLDPLHFLTGLSGRLASVSPAFLDALTAQGADILIRVNQNVGVAQPGAKVTGVVVQVNGNISVRAALGRLVLKPFQALVDTGWRARFVVLVDALDEALTYSADGNLVAVLADAVRELPFRFIVTSRPDPRVTGLLGEGQLDLTRDQPDGVSDVYEYAQRRLHLVPEPARSTLAQNIARAGDENFLYARYVLDDILSRDGLPDGRTASIETLPHGLDEVYHDFLARELAANDERWEERYRPVLGALSVARDTGLTTGQLAGVTGLKRSRVHDTLKRTRQYLTGTDPDGPYHLYHRSFVEYLTNSVDHQIFADEAQHDVAKHFVDQWRSDPDRLDDYGLAHLADHLATAGMTQVLVGLLDQQWMAARLTRAAGAYSGFITDVETALRAVLAAPQPRLDWLARLYAARMVAQEATLSRSDADLEILTRLGRREEAVAHAILRPSARDQVSGLLAVRRGLDSDSPAASELLASAQRIALATPNADDQATSLRQIIAADGTIPTSTPAVVDAAVAAAVAAVQEIPSTSDRAVASRDLVAVLANAKRLRDAVGVMRAIDNPIQQSWAKLHLVRALTGAGDVAAAARFLPQAGESSSDEGIRAKIQAEALATFAAGLARSGDRLAVDERFRQAQTAARSIEREFDQQDAMYEVVTALVAAGALLEAQRLTVSMSGWSRERALHAVVTGYDAAGDRSSADAVLALMSRTEDGGTWRQFAERDLALSRGRAGAVSEAINQLRALSPTTRAYALCFLGRDIHARGDARCVEVLRLARQWSRDIEERTARLDILRAVVRALVATGQVDEAADCYTEFEHLASAPAPRDLPDHVASLAEVAACLARVHVAASSKIFAAAQRQLATLPAVDRKGAERALAAAALSCGEVDLAWRTATADPFDLQRVPLWCDLARALAATDPDRARSAVEHARTLTGRMNADARDRELRIVLTVLADLGWFDEAETVIAGIGRGEACAALVQCARAVFPRGPGRAERLLRDAETRARQEWSDATRGSGLVDVMSAWLAIGNAGEPARIVVTIDDDLARVEGLARLAGWLASRSRSPGPSLLEAGFKLAAACQAGDAETIWTARVVAYERKGELPAKPSSQPLALDESQWFGWFWGEPQYRARALGWLATALSDCHDARATTAFGLAHEAARSVPYERSRDTALQQLGEDLIGVGRITAAETVLADIRDSSARSAAHGRLYAAWMRLGRLDDAARVAQDVEGAWLDGYTHLTQEELLRGVAIDHARAGRPAPALGVARAKTLDGYLRSLASVLLHSTATSAAQTRDALVAALTVTAWTRADWKDVLAWVAMPSLP